MTLAFMLLSIILGHNSQSFQKFSVSLLKNYSFYSKLVTLSPPLFP